LLPFIAEPNVPKNPYSPQHTVPVYDHSFPHSAQNLATTTAGQQQALHLLLVKTTYSLSTILPEVEGR